MMKEASGMVLILECDRCGKSFPHFQFSGDSDIDTEGLCSASSCARNEIVIGELEAEEYERFDEEGAGRFENRLKQQIKCDDCRVVRLLRVEQQSESGQGRSFQDFLKTYHPPKLVFSCACCGEGESTPKDELTVEQFRNMGGKISTIGRIVVQSEV